MRAVFPIRLTAGAAPVALILWGCGSVPAGPEVAATTDNGADQALRAVVACQDQAQGCRADGGGEACEDQLRTCLTAILPDGGGPPEGKGPPDAGNNGQSSAPGQDDAGPPHDNGGDGGARVDIDDGGSSRPPLPEAAVIALTKPVGPAEGGSTTLPCVDGLRACLATAVSPDTCADTFRTCQEAAVAARHPDGGGPH